MNSKEPSYHEVELPYESFSISWETYNELRLRIAELENALLTTQDAITEIRVKYEAFKERYAHLIEEDNLEQSQ